MNEALSRRLAAAALAALAPALVAGCAVLTVDVDVYKGPLSNTDDVQAEQVASLVDAVRVLLLETRERLGRRDNTGDPSLAYQLVVVNQVVGLYEDVKEAKPLPDSFKTAMTAVTESAARSAEPPLEVSRALIRLHAEIDKLEPTALSLREHILNQSADVVGSSIDLDNLPDDVKAELNAETSDEADVRRAVRSAKSGTLTRLASAGKGLRPPEKRKLANLWYVIAAALLNESRLPEGLNTVIRGYRLAAKELAVAPQDPVRRDAIRAAKSLMLDQFAAFATRTSTFANANSLLEVSGNGWLTTYFKDSLNNALGFSFGERDDEATSASVRLLQAVGNMIMAQVDMLRARDDMKSRGGLDPAKLEEFVKKRYSDPANEADGAVQSLQELEAKLRIELALQHKQLADAEADGDQAKCAGRKSAISALEASIRAVHDLRADSVFIRPAAAFLKAAVPTTAVQDGTTLAWHNMLEEHGMHLEPFDSLVPNGSAKRAAMQEELDRQSWQNINQIRVAAGGDTTYALTKDDVGNWYVKGFSGDPKPIIDGAAGLALHGFGIQHGVDAAAVAAGEISAEDAVKDSTRGRQVAAVRRRYFSEAVRDAADFQRDFEGAADAVLAQWAADPAVKAGLDVKRLSALVAAAHFRHFDPWRRTAAGADDGRAVIRRLYDGIAAARRFGDAAAVATTADEVKLNPQDVSEAHVKVVNGAVTKASELARGVVKDLCERYLQRRRVEHDRAEGALDGIADSTN